MVLVPTGEGLAEEERKMLVGSLFSGIGAMDYGLQRAGMKIAWQVEINDFCRAVLEKHWPDVPKYKDIREVKPDELEPVDLICGGFPCQPFSAAGKRRGTADDRYLWPEMFRVIKALRPRWVLGENVAGIVNLALDTVLSDLESEGYETATFIIPACAVGAPHRRDRVWIVAYSAGVERQSGAKEQEVLRGVPADGEKCYNAGGSGKAQSWEDVAHASSIQTHSKCQKSFGLGKCRWNTVEPWEKTIRQKNEKASYDHLGRCSQNVAYAAGKRLEGEVNQARQVTGCNKGEIESRLGGIVNGLACWVDLYNWPAPLGCEQHDWEPPRTMLEKPPFWKERIQALGNAVVPQVVEVVGRAILAVDHLYNNIAS